MNPATFSSILLERPSGQVQREDPSMFRALTEAVIRIIFVTHLYDLAERYFAQHDPATLFLRAERQPDEHRTFLLPPGQPLPTSYGQDLYQQVFGVADQEQTADQAREVRM